MAERGRVSWTPCLTLGSRLVVSPSTPQSLRLLTHNGDCSIAAHQTRVFSAASRRVDASLIAVHATTAGKLVLDITGLIAPPPSIDVLTAAKIIWNDSVLLKDSKMGSPQHSAIGNGNTVPG